MAVLAFLLSKETCKIPHMKIDQYLLSILLIGLLFADNQTPADILLKTFHRMDGINHSFKVDSKSSRKKKKEKHFEVSIHWLPEGTLLQQTRITSITSKRKKPSSFWVHRFRDGSKTKKWMSMPITGKLKDISDKKVGKKDFSFSELIVTDKDIKSQDHELLSQEKVNKLLVYVIESKEKDNNGKIKESKKLWIDIDSYMILKVEFYTRTSRLYRSIECSEFHYVKDILFPKNIYVEDFKSKTYTQIIVRDIEINPDFDMDIFIPRDQ